MAQLPLKLPPNFYDAPAVSDHCSPRPSSLSENPSFRSIRSLFGSPKGREASSSPSSKRFKLITCFSNGNQHPEAESGTCDNVAWDCSSDPVMSSGTQSSEEDSNEIKRDSSIPSPGPNEGSKNVGIALNASNARRAASFVGKVMKVRKKDSESRIWKKPIMMGKRCSKLADEFPYDGCDEETNAVAGAAADTVAAESSRSET